MSRLFCLRKLRFTLFVLVHLVYLTHYAILKAIMPTGTQSSQSRSVLLSPIPTPISAPVWPVYGHHWVVELLQQATAPAASVTSSGGPRQAYLFLGPRQIGKSTLVRAFAQAMLCTHAQQRPCGACRACRLLARGSHPDFRIIQPVDKNGDPDRLDGTLKVEQAAEIIHDVPLRPVEGRYKLFLIQDAHSANDSFANKLLKTLEEPPEHVVICLTALDRAGLLPTIVSRCQVMELRPLDRVTVAQALMHGWQAEASQAELLARLANGRLGWAVEQLQEPARQRSRVEQLETLWRLINDSRIERLAFAEQLSANRNNQQLFALLELWTTWWRDIFLTQSGCRDACSNVDQPAELERQAQALAPTVVQHYLQTLSHIEGYLHHTVNTRLALDVLLLQLPHIHK